MAKVCRAEGPQSVLVLDWDDTLMCSSWISKASLKHAVGAADQERKSSIGAVAGAVLRDPSVLRPAVAKELELLANAVRDLLEEAKRVLPKDRIIIVTNSEAGWVQLSAAAFLRPALPALTGLRIVSARSAFETYFPDQPSCWKAAAFAYEIHEIMKRIASGDEALADVHRIVSVGDGFQERDGCAIACAQFGIKGVSLRMMPTPDPRQLRVQLAVVQQELAMLCTSGDDWLELQCVPQQRDSGASIVLHPIARIEGSAKLDRPSARSAVPAKVDYSQKREDDESDLHSATSADTCSELDTDSMAGLEFPPDEVDSSSRRLVMMHLNEDQTSDEESSEVDGEDADAAASNPEHAAQLMQMLSIANEGAPAFEEEAPVLKGKVPTLKEKVPTFKREVGYGKCGIKRERSFDHASGSWELAEGVASEASGPGRIKVGGDLGHHPRRSGERRRRRKLPAQPVATISTRRDHTPDPVPSARKPLYRRDSDGVKQKAEGPDSEQAALNGRGEHMKSRRALSSLRKRSSKERGRAHRGCIRPIAFSCPIED